MKIFKDYTLSCFGVERDLDQQNPDFSSAYILSLRLIGFIDSRSQLDIDQAFLQQTRRQALTYLHTAKHSLTPLTDRLRTSNGSKSFFNLKNNNPEDCIVIGRPQSHGIHTKGPGVSSVFEVEGEGEGRACGNTFPTKRAHVEMDVKQKRGAIGSPSAPVSPQCDNSPANRLYGGRSYGVSRRGIRGNFVPPIKSNGNNTGNITSRIAGNKCGDSESTKKWSFGNAVWSCPDGELPEKLRNLEPRLIEHVSNEIMDKDPNVLWDDIAGLAHAKSCVDEMVILPLQRPDLFMGCRSPGRGLLLFGPPGTGKTMIGKAIAGQAKATFFYISASSLTSNLLQLIGEGEKLVRALFGVASCRQPAVIFVDEIDSLLSQRKSDGEHEASRRLKTQFLIEMEGFGDGNDQIMLIGNC
ncbi:hypothetical protein TSUD_159740 [Trifolium subterraneum]|uniref:AAA+ ATPase domain-containing protein n=1 Tax=Trifolium subterraneum TaxID=3900 RepID=A0A2Z6MVY4_TRISU|nr:hypothetical protein TSUD_159740 [Trifolium subterraneum]